MLGASHEVVRALGDFGRDAGVALQILDDLAELSRGREQGEDLRGARPTWPWVFAARRTSPLAYAGLRALGRSVRDGSGDLDRLASELREHSAHTGRRTASTLLDAAAARLRAVVPDRDLFAAFERIIERLELSRA
jgi:geranylgeranyl pyrophosphate synthase